MIKIIILSVVAVAAMTLAIILVRFNLKRVYIIRRAEAATDEQLEAIYARLELLGTETPSCAVLARTNRRNNTLGDLVPVPRYVQGWAGRIVAIKSDSSVTFRFIESAVATPSLRGRVYRLIPVPRHRTNTGKARNQFSPNAYVNNDPELSKVLQSICPRYPIELLCFLLAAGAETFEFDSINQARVGGSPSWVQDAEFPNCDECKKRMSLVLQIPGTMLPGKTLPSGTFFLFGCVNHPNLTKTVAQFT